ncbi:DUF2283 domain-containing protein [candidate division KSB1 bacterium]|nr:DUF2283 domain-containing protein [candidate division KSB1 bacterium]
MKVKYFADTDTVLIEFSEIPPTETRELNENIYLDLDDQGKVVSLTIEHAKQAAAINEFSYQIIPAFTPAA